MTTNPRFAEIRAAAIAALGTPTFDGESATGARRVTWGNDRIVLMSPSDAVYFVDDHAHGAWWIVDDMARLPTVTLTDALNALRPLVNR